MSERDTTPSPHSSPRRQFTLSDKKRYLTLYDREHPSTMTNFCRKHSLPRTTFAEWYKKKDSYLNPPQTFAFDRIRRRESNKPELDIMLYEWYIDFRKRRPTFPVDFSVLYEKAVHFEQLLRFPHITNTNTNNEQHEQPSVSSTLDDHFTPDMFVEDFDPSQLQPQCSSSSIDSTTEQTTQLYRGLTNPSNRCFLNSIVQILYNIPAFKQRILDLEIEDPNTLAQVVSKDLQQVFMDLQNSSTDGANSGQLYKDFRKPDGTSVTAAFQEDAAEFIDNLITALDSDIESLSPDEQHRIEPYRNMLGMNYIHQYICPAGHITESAQKMLLLPVALDDTSDLIDALKKLSLGDRVESYTCPKCVEKNYISSAFSRTFIQADSDTFIIQLNRFTFSSSSTYSRKNNSYFEFPINSLIDLSPFTKDSALRDEIGETEASIYHYIKQKAQLYRVTTHSHPTILLSEELESPDSSTDTLEDEKGMRRMGGKRKHNSVSQFSKVANPVDSYIEATGRTPTSQPTQLDSTIPTDATSTPHTLQIIGDRERVKSHTLPLDRAYLYYLSSVVAHTGGVNRGHYITYERSDENSSDWYCIDDRTVFQVNEDTLPTELFGLQMPRAKTRHNNAPISTAYLLVYRRCSPIPTETQTVPRTTLSIEEKESISASEEPELSQTASSPSSESDEDVTPSIYQKFSNKEICNWLTGWIKRHHLKRKTLHGEAGDADLKIKEIWIKSDLQDIFRRFNPEDIWNADEIGLFYNQITRHIYVDNTEKIHGGKQPKARLSLFLAASMTGKKRRLLIISNQVGPLSIMEKQVRPYDYYQQQNSWMDSKGFTEYIHRWDAELASLNKEIALIVDNAAVHPTPTDLTNIHLFKLPSSLTSILQPVDMGIGRSMKASYRSLLLSSLLKSDGAAGKWKIYSYIKLMCQAWAIVKPQTIANCFLAAGWIDYHVQFPSRKTIGIEKPSSTAAIDSDGQNCTDAQEPLRKSVQTALEALQAEEGNERLQIERNVEKLRATREHAEGDTHSDDDENSFSGEIIDENEFSREPFKEREQETALRVLGFTKPKEEYDLRDIQTKRVDEENKEEDGEESKDDEPDIDLNLGLTILQKYADRLPVSYKKYLISNVIHSLKTESQSTKPPSTSKNLIQTQLKFT